MLSKLTGYQKAILAMVVANIIWGAASPIFKLSLQNIPPFSLAFLRFFLATIILFPFVHKDLHNFKKQVDNWKEIVGYALTGITINIIFFFLALRLTTSITAPIIGSAGPIALIIFGALFLNEKVTGRKIIGSAVSFLGVLLLIIEPILDKGFDGSLIGNLFLVIATLGAVGQTIYGRRLAHKYPPLPLTFWAFFIGTLTFIPLAFPEILHFPQLDWRGILGIIYGAVFSSTIAYSLFAWGLSKIEASEAGLYFYLDPIVAIVIAYPLLGEKPSIPFLVGSVLVFAGILIAEKRLNYHPLHKLIQYAKSQYQ